MCDRDALEYHLSLNHQSSFKSYDISEPSLTLLFRWVNSQKCDEIGLTVPWGRVERDMSQSASAAKYQPTYGTPCFGRYKAYYHSPEMAQ